MTRIDLVNINDVSVFAPQVGSQFRIELDAEQSVSAELVEAKAFDGQQDQTGEPSRVPFSLLFSVGDGVDLPQQIYRLSHEVLGDIELFLVPLGNGQSESVFN